MWQAEQSGDEGFYSAVNELMSHRCGDCPGAPEVGSHAKTRHTHIHTETHEHKEEGDGTRSEGKQGKHKETGG